MGALGRKKEGKRELRHFFLFSLLFWCFSDDSWPPRSRLVSCGSSPPQAPAVTQFLPVSFQTSECSWLPTTGKPWVLQNLWFPSPTDASLKKSPFINFCSTPCSWGCLSRPNRDPLNTHQTKGKAKRQNKAQRWRPLNFIGIGLTFYKLESKYFVQ